MDRVRAEGITVTFGGVDVVSRVDLTLRAGEVHAITGENGAGKSSLAKAIAGVYRFREGALYVDGLERPVEFRTPREALHAGIALIHQEPSTFPDLNVAESIFAGNPIRRGPFVDWQKCHSKARGLLESLGVDLDTRSTMGNLSVAQRQLVELAGALAHDAKVWIFDETTAPLTPAEVAELFRVIRRLRSEGCAVAIVSHHLHEVFEIADRITVLRDGRKVVEHTTAETNPGEIVRAMVGRELSGERFEPGLTGDVRLEAEGLCGPGFRDIDLSVRAGEIVGVAGLVGAGRTELARALFGIVRPTSGVIRVDGRPRAFRSPRDAMRSGVALVPEDRIHDGLLQPQSVEYNATLACLPMVSAGGFLLPKAISERSESATASLALKRRSLDQPVAELSGGNQQKVVLAKWLITDPKVLILDEPTRGVDVGAKHEVHKAVHALAASGLAVLMVSSDLNEILTLSHRILVMREGTLVASFPQGEATQEAIMRAATGEVAHA